MKTKTLKSADFIKSVKWIYENVKEEDRHREYLKLYSKQGKKFAVSINEKIDGNWQENYTDSKFEPRINLIGRLANVLVVEYDNPKTEDGMEPQEAFEQTEKELKKMGFAFIRTTHQGKSDYLWVEFSKTISEEDALRFYSWICPSKARIDVNFAYVSKIFPVIFAPHRKYSARKEEIVFFNEGDKINFSKLKIPKNIKVEVITETNSDGYSYPTIERTESSKVETPKEIPENLKQILLNPNLFKEITEEEFDKRIVGEKESRKVIFLCANGRLVENCQTASYNLLVNDDAGVGKDYVTEAVLSIFPKDFYIHKTRISPAVFTYWHNPKFEPQWTWDGKIFYPEDISESVLNSDVFKVMCSKGSSATIVINQVAYEIDIAGKPIMITTTATATPNPELTRRFVILNLDSSENQTKAIMKRHSEFKKKGIVPEYNQDYTEAMKYLKRVKVKIPFADLIDKHFPADNVIMRTHYPRFLDFICASAGFHQYQRQKDKEGFILAEAQDYEIARDCFLKLCSNRFMISLTINQKRILEIFENSPNLKGSVSKLHAIMPFISDRALLTNLGILAGYGLLETSTEKDSWNRDIEVYSLAQSYKPNERINIPKFDKICSFTSEPSIPSISSKPSIPSIPLSKSNKENQIGSEGLEGSEGKKGGQEPFTAQEIKE